jgi:hypothetical protein
MTAYRGFPERLHHQVPHWVEEGAWFHIRIALNRNVQQRELIEQDLARPLLESALFYQNEQLWYIGVFLLMPDHLHAVISFGREKVMSELIRDWKRFHTRNHSAVWQENYFDHRLRNDARADQLSAKIDYIRQNPVVSGLCKSADQWPWKIDQL